jgi:glycosyltransferase involved in cell wall biosynthesis
MRLGINGWRLHGARTGVGRYLLNVARHWSPGGPFGEITLYTSRPVDRAETPLPEGIKERVLGPPWPMLPWENLCLGPRAADDVLFCPSYSRPLYVRGAAVVTTHDAVLHLFPELFPRSGGLFYDRLYGWSARHAALVITDSEAARTDIVRGYGVPAERVRVVYLAPAEVFRPAGADQGVADTGRRYVGSDDPYFLFVGKMTGRRSVPVMVEGFAELKRRTAAPHKLVLVGPETGNVDLPGLVARLGIDAHVIRHRFVPDQDLRRLYNGAAALLSPSIYETVSLPVLEAQASGTPVVCVGTAGMREITGEAALLMPQTDVAEMFKALARLAQEPGLGRELSERGLQNARRFSWKRCADETLAVLEEAGRRRPNERP